MQKAQKQAKSSGLSFRVALVVVATGAYVEYVQLFALSASRLFIADHEVSVLCVWSYVCGAICGAICNPPAHHEYHQVSRPCLLLLKLRSSVVVGGFEAGTGRRCNTLF